MGHAPSPNLPIIVSENGVRSMRMTLRPRYIAQHIHQMWRAVNFNFPIKGYFHWSLVDNFEWDQGWTLRFGLWGLDVEHPKADETSQRGPVC
jgi:beta-glucosidase